ncbi:TonB-dependent receptor [Novosphingobium sp. ZN18A2]|uniref:TonB-dependent receptor n=1 Tax=Novosphingobium sp. ZN18A2 TaxID=3079861 RepID=UPI0030CBE50B
MRFTAVSLSVLAMAIATPAAAQDQSSQQAQNDQQGGIQQIVVTAQKRAENVQDVPIAISAFTASALKERAVGDVANLSSISPNVTLDSSTPFSGSSAVLGASIRGIGSADFAFNIDQTVGVYLDGVYLGRSVGANQDLLDVERIEILKGPQGTLFGRNTIGGAISIVTHDPGDTFRFVGDVTTGSYKRMQVRGTMDVPLATNLSSSVSFAMMRRDGYQHRIPYTQAAPYSVDSFQNFAAAGYNNNGNRQGGDDSWSARAKIKYDTDHFKATFAFDYTNVDQESTANSLLATTEMVPGPFGGLAANDVPGTALDPSPTSPTGFLFAGLYNFCVTSTAAQIAARNAGNLCGPRTGVNGFNTLPALAGAAIPGPGNPNPLMVYNSRFVTGNPDTTYANGNNYSKVRQHGFTLTLEDDVTDSFQIKSITAYRQVDFNAGVDLDGSPMNFLQTSFTVKQHQWSQELQLNGSALGNRLKYTLGGYFFNEVGGLHDYVTFADGLLQVDGPGRINTVSYAAYGQLDFRVNDLIGLTLGGRYTREDKNYYGGQADDNGFNYKLFNCPAAGGLPTAACGAALGFPINNNYAAYFLNGSNAYGSNLGSLATLLDYYPNSPNSAKFSNFSPKAGIQIHPTDRVMIYGTWSRGYRSGGWTTRLSNPLLVAPTFGPEKAESFEVGVKSQILDRKLQLNLAAFTTRYKGIQLNQQIGVSPTVANLGIAQIKGFEVEMVAAPTRALTINGSVGYLDAHFSYICGESGTPQSFCAGNSAYVPTNPFQAGIYAGAPLPKAPEWKFNISPRLEVPVGIGNVVFLLDYTHTSSMRNDTEGTFLLMRQPTDILNGSIAFTPDSGHWNLTVGGTNITDQRYIITGQAQIAGGEIYGTYNRPAEWYARLGVKF